MENNYYPFVNLPLRYSYDALEPYIDRKTMYLHHDKHLETYIKNLNDAVKDCPHLQKMSLEQLVRIDHRKGGDIQTAVHNNAGGVFNHRFFFDGLCSPAFPEPSGELAQAIQCRYGSFSEFKKEFTKEALSVFGSGYAWLTSDKGKLNIIKTANQDSPIQKCLCPVLCIDVWEHAYYLKNYNVRADYIKDWFRIINWDQAQLNYLNSLGCTSTYNRY